MTPLTESATWGSAIRELLTTDAALGGPPIVDVNGDPVLGPDGRSIGGDLNIAPAQLANRTAWLKAVLDAGISAVGITPNAADISQLAGALLRRQVSGVTTYSAAGAYNLDGLSSIVIVANAASGSTLTIPSSIQPGVIFIVFTQSYATATVVSENGLPFVTLGAVGQGRSSELYGSTLQLAAGQWALFFSGGNASGLVRVLTSIPPLTAVPLIGADATADNHAITKGQADARYAGANHNHDAAYSPSTHTHNSLYARRAFSTANGLITAGLEAISYSNYFMLYGGFWEVRSYIDFTNVYAGTTVTIIDSNGTALSSPVTFSGTAGRVLTQTYFNNISPGTYDVRLKFVNGGSLQGNYTMTNFCYNNT